ncbi:MAG: DUF1566 domain-containing protein [Candidatus Cloacimonetes bacterium]|nr:DUF1566 domain-containing protein [Candidatus Cloacimonadota bacterium]
MIKNMMMIASIAVLLLTLSCSDKTTKNKETTAKVTINLTTSDVGSVYGAFVILQNNSDPSFSYGQSASGNTVTFAGVIYGSYTLTVTLEGYTTYVNSNIFIQVETYNTPVHLIATPINFSRVTINPTTSDGGSITGAFVILQKSGDSSTCYIQSASSSSVTFPSVVYGRYTLTVTHTGYATYVNNSIMIYTETFIQPVELTATTTPIEVSLITINIDHNYYAFENTSPINIILKNINGDPSLIYADTTVGNSVVFPAVVYGSYELTVTNQAFTTYTAYVNIAAPLVNRDVSLSFQGSSGGFIFYDKGYKSDGWRYMEAAPYSAEFEAQWGSYGTLIGGTSAAIGTGKENTQIIIDWLNSHGETDRAAQLCIALNVEEEWFLPSKDELTLMYQYLRLRGIGDFGASGSNNRWIYWSSSEYSNNAAWSMYFQYGSQDYNNEYNSFRVRAVRTF